MAIEFSPKVLSYPVLTPEDEAIRKANAFTVMTPLDEGIRKADAFTVLTPLDEGIHKANAFTVMTATNEGIRKFIAYAVVTAVVPVFGMSELELIESPVTDGNRDVTLRYSDDAGANWSQPLNQTIGDIGDYEVSPQWRRLGMSRDRVIELSWSCEFITALTGVMIQYTIAGT